MSLDSAVHLLALDWSQLPANVSGSMQFEPADVAALLGSAGAREELEMVIVATPHRFQVYTVGAGRSDALRAVLRSVLGRGRGFTRLGNARAVEASGVAAARELFRCAAGLDAELALGLRGLYAVTSAAALAVECGTLGEHLSRLFEHANRAAWTARSETELGAALLSSERRELARFSVERILEEQLLVWQSTYAEPRTAQTDLPMQYTADETSSIVRLKRPSAVRESVA